MNKQLMIPAAIGLVVLALIVGVVITVARSVNETTSREYRIVIPEGTSALIAAGEDPGVIPEQITLKLDEKDILVIENNDLEGHRIGGFYVGAGETLRQEFRTPAVYEGECTIHESNQVQIIVSE